MKQAIRAISWATNILWIVILIFTITAIHSAFQLRFGFADPETSVSNEMMIVSLPFNISNGGFYDISNLNLTTRVESSQGISISNSSTFIPLISRGENARKAHNISLSLSDMLSKGLSNMLFNDSTLNVDVILKVEYAEVIPLQISSNFSIPWGAPLYNLTLGRPSFDGTYVTIPISFENHSLFALNGTMTLELFNDSSQQVGSSTVAVNAPLQSGYSTQIRVLVSGDPSRVREARLRFDTPIFSYSYCPVGVHIV